MTLIEYLKIPDTPNRYWQIGTFFGLLTLAIVYLSIAIWYKQTYGQFTSAPASVKSLLTIRNHDLSTSVAGTPNNNIQGVCKMLVNKTPPYDSFTENAMVNWRPLTVRLAGYLGGIHSPRDGVFDMDNGIQYALNQGARAFVFDIDYLEESPCNAVLVHRDSGGIMRSLHTGSIKDGCKRLTSTAFQNNKDPVLVILYFRRIPEGVNQQASFFGSVASSLDPLSKYHLGMNSQGNYHNCKSESDLFTSPITDFQNNFIVLTNYDTSQIVSTPNPKDNLDFWTNARIYQDPSGSTNAINSVTPPAPTSGIPSVKIASTSQLLNIGSSDLSAYKEKTASTFTIALSDIEYSFTSNEVNKLLNILGVHCVPLDVVRLSANPEHEKSIQLAGQNNPTVSDLTNVKNPNDVLSFWSYGGWSRKLIIEGFENSSPVEPAKPIPGFIIPKPVQPKKPSASTNSNGGLVTIGD